MADNDLHDFFQQQAVEIAAEYERIRKRSREDAGTAGDEGEENWREILSGWLPSEYNVTTKGRIMVPNGWSGGQVDVVVHNRSYPRRLREKKMHLAGGVAAVFECKLTLRPGDITRAVKKCAELKAALPKRYGSPYKELVAPMIFGVLAHSHDFGANAEEKIHLEILTASQAYVDHPIKEIDLVCVADLKAWHHSVMQFLFHHPPPQLEGPVMTSFLQAEGNPIANAINYTTKRLAWEDPTLRSLSEYYRTVLSPQGRGNIRHWPQSVVTEQLLRQPAFDGGGGWSHWNGHYY